jgi:PAS domain S-box-containing protein
MRLSLAAKGLILVAIPLCFELAFVVVLVDLQRQAEAESAIALRSKKVAQGIAAQTHDLFALWQTIYNTTRTQWRSTGRFDQSYKPGVAKLLACYSELIALTPDDPEINRRVRISRATLLNAEVILDSMMTRLNDHDGSQFLTDEVLAIKQIQSTFHALVEQNHELEAVFRKKNSEKDSNRQIELRQRILTVATFAAIVNVLLSIAVAVFLLKDVVGRLRLLQDNATRLASGKQLRAPLQGSDEIAEVDRVFRRMARALTESNHKEHAVVENALDTICAIDKDGRFSTANPASFKLFGLEPEDLIGTRLVDAIAEEDKARILLWVTELREKKERVASQSEREKEFRVRRRNGSVVDTLWSGHWSEEELSLFVVVHDMTDRKELERAKQELVAMLTHDLRSPLTTIQGMIEMAQAGMLGELNERGVRLTNAAERNSSRMLSLINDLLDIEKIKSGTMTLEKEKVSLTELFDEVKANVSDWTAVNGIIIDCQATNLSVSGDREKISRVIFNLLSNAIKFSPPGGHIELSARAKDKFVEITVSDQGPGMPPEMVSSIFERFQQGTGAAHKGKGGSGLGLAICKEIVNLHGGKIWVTTEEGKGSQFHFTIEG